MTGEKTHTEPAAMREHKNNHNFITGYPKMTNNGAKQRAACIKAFEADLIKLCAKYESGNEAAAQPEETKDEALEIRLATLGANQFSANMVRICDKYKKRGVDISTVALRPDVFKLMQDAYDRHGEFNPRHLDHPVQETPSVLTRLARLFQFITLVIISLCLCFALGLVILVLLERGFNYLGGI